VVSVEVDEGGAVIAGRSPVLDADPGPTLAIARGLAIHRLIEVLPDLSKAERRPAAERYLERVGANWHPAERAKMLKAIEAVLDAPELRALWGENSRAEVAITGTVDVKGAPRAVSGKIDRLAVGVDEVLIVDFKTSRPAPLGINELPPAYIAQLALYRALLQPLYPGRRVSATLVFTEAARVIAVPEERMDAMLAELATTELGTGDEPA
jgi:ATP-dependent helicase/nuclease subunit A